MLYIEDEISMTETIIRTENLTRYFDNTRAVDSLSLEISSGTIFGFLGPNGAGKTTTIRLLLGLLEPTSGRAEVLGFDTRAQADKIRSSAGALLEHDGLYERLSAEDNLEFYARVWHLPLAERRARINELLTHLSLWDRRKEMVKTWSRGMRQKLALARALLHHPSLLFLDEPTAGLDPIAATALREDLAGMATREGVTIFLTTHNLAEAEKLCGKVGVIADGKLIAAGTPDELRLRVKGSRVEIIGRSLDEKITGLLRAREEVNMVNLQKDRLLIELREKADIAPLITLMVNAGAEIEEVHKASLEETFLKLVGEEK